MDSRLGDREGKKIWSIAAGMETHIAFVQTAPDGGAANRFFNFYSLSPQIFITKYDQIRADAGFFEHFIADVGESGLRFADVSLSYARSIPILTEDGIPPSAVPTKGVVVRAGLSASAPTSFSSRLIGIITVLRARLSVEKAFFDHSLFLSVGGFGEYYVDEYRSPAGGGTNALSRYSVQASADYAIPGLKRLSVGIAGGSSWVYFYGLEGASTTAYGTVADPQYTSQPVEQGYGMQANANYALPTIKEIGSSFSLTYAMGDNALHDGVQHIYFGFYRRSTELAAALSLRY